MSVLTTEEVHYESKLLDLLASLGSGGGGTISEGRLGAIAYVKAKLDEIIPEATGVIFSLSVSPDVSNPLDLLIDAHLDECTKDVSLSAPLTVLKPKASEETAGTPFIEAGLTGYIPLPTDFLRLSSFKMAEWEREVPGEEVITPHNPKYKKQSNQYLMGKPVKPVAALNWKSIGTPTAIMTRVLEYYSVEVEHDIEKLFYIPQMVAEDFLTDNPMLLDALAWSVAGKIMQITGMVTEAKLAQERVTQAYNNL